MRKLILSLLVVALFAPVPLAVGGLRPAWLTDPLIGAVPASALIVAAYLAVFVVLVWTFAGAAFARAHKAGDGQEPRA